MTLKEAQELVDRWIREYGVRYFSELTNMAVLTEEVGELARVISLRYRDTADKPSVKRWRMCSGYCSVWPIRQA